MRAKLAVALGTCVASLALVAGGCGGDDESSTEPAAEWAESFCTAVTAWTDELQQIGEDIGEPSSLDLDALEQAADDVGVATDAFIEDVRELGAPDTASGQAVQDSLESLADTLETEKSDIETAIDDASGITGIASAISAIGTSLTAMGSAFQGTLEAIEDADASGELETALEESDACDAIAG